MTSSFASGYFCVTTLQKILNSSYLEELPTGVLANQIGVFICICYTVTLVSSTRLANL